MPKTSFKNSFARFDSAKHPQAKQKSRFIQEMFSGISPSYDRLNRVLSMRMDVAWRKRLVEESGVCAGEKVLDVCTGTGDVLLEFIKRVPGCLGVGLDFSQGMLEVAKTKFNGREVRWLQGDALKLPFKKANFETSCMAFGMRNVVDVLKAFSEMKRVTKRGRKVMALELTRPDSLFLKLLYVPYLHFYLPLMGRLLSGNGQAYQYLRDSIQGFFGPEKVLAFMQKAGLKDCRAIRLSGGIATLYVGRVP